MNEMFKITLIIFTNQMAVGEPLFCVSQFFKSGNWACCEAEFENIRKGNKNFEGVLVRKGI